MKDRLSWSCSRMREHSMRPDVTTTKTLMYRVAMRWDSLILTATDIEVRSSSRCLHGYSMITIQCNLPLFQERFDIIYKATPTKIMMVNSQEISIADIDGIPNSPKTVSDVEIKNEDTQWRTPLLEPTATDQDSKGKQPVHLHRVSTRVLRNFRLKLEGSFVSRSGHDVNIEGHHNGSFSCVLGVQTVKVCCYWDSNRRSPACKTGTLTTTPQQLTLDNTNTQSAITIFTLQPRDWFFQIISRSNLPHCAYIN